MSQSLVDWKGNQVGSYTYLKNVLYVSVFLRGEVCEHLPETVLGVRRKDCFFYPHKYNYSYQHLQSRVRARSL